MQSFQTSDGLRLAYDVTGSDGPPLLCLAGLTRNSADFEPIVAAFADRARIVRMDYRGRGQSDHDKDFMNYAIPVEARDALELLDHLELEQAAILGTSRGGLIAMGLAAGAKDRLLGVALNDIGPVIHQAGIEFIMTYVGVIPPPELTLARMAQLRSETSQDQFPGVGPETWEEFLAKQYEQTPQGLKLRYDPRLRDAVQAMAEASFDPDLWPYFDAMEGLPLALLRGENSDILSPETAQEMARRRPDMIYAEIPDRGHIPFLDEPESRAALARFLDAL